MSAPRSSELLRVPTTTLFVEVALAGHAPEDLALHVACGPDGPTGIAALVELLEQDEPFLPARPASGARMVFLRRDGIARVSLPRPADGDAGIGEDDELFDVATAVRVELSGGEALEGQLLYSAPPGRARLSDHLNGPGRFLRLWAGERLHLVQKRHVSRLVEVGREDSSSTTTAPHAGARPRVELVRED